MDVAQIDLAGFWQSLGNPFTNLPPAAGYMLGLLGFFLAIIVITEFFQRRAMMQHLQMLSEASDEQSRRIERMRRSLADIMEHVVALENASRVQAVPEQAPPPAIPSQSMGVSVSQNNSAAALRQEIESLRAEFESELPQGSQRD